MRITDAGRSALAQHERLRRTHCRLRERGCWQLERHARGEHRCREPVDRAPPVERDQDRREDLSVAHDRPWPGRLSDWHSDPHDEEGMGKLNSGFLVWLICSIAI